MGQFIKCDLTSLSERLLVLTSFRWSRRSLNYLGPQGTLSLSDMFLPTLPKAGRRALLAGVPPGSLRSLCLMNQFFLHPSFLQPPLPTTLTPVSREPSRKPISMSPYGEVTGSPSPPPRSGIPTPSPSTPALSPVWVSPFLLSLTECLLESSGVPFVLQRLRNNERLAIHHPLPLCCPFLSHQILGSSCQSNPNSLLAPLTAPHPTLYLFPHFPSCSPRLSLMPPPTKLSADCRLLYWDQ